MPGLILEGIVGAGKTSVYERLLAHPRFRAREATLALPEAYTERAFEHMPERGPAESQALIDRILGSLESLDALHRSGKFRERAALGLAWLLERFHLSHAIMTGVAPGDPEARLAALDGRLAVLKVPQAHIADRLARTRQHRPESWSWYMDHKVAGRTPAMDEAEVTARLAIHYAAQQECLLALAEASRLPTLVLDTSQEDWEALADQLITFWGL